MIKRQRIDNVCIINAAGELKALAAREWFKDSRFYPAPGAPSLDAAGRLLCGAAVGTRDSDKVGVAEQTRWGRLSYLLKDPASAKLIARFLFHVSPARCSGCPPPHS